MASECPDFHHPERKLPDDCECVRKSGHADRGLRHLCEHGYLWGDDRIDAMERAERDAALRARDRAALRDLASHHLTPDARDGERTGIDSFIESVLDAGFTTERKNHT